MASGARCRRARRAVADVSGLGKLDRLTGPTWERLLDERSPPNRALPESIVVSVRTLREVDRTMTTEKAREWGPNQCCTSTIALVRSRFLISRGAGRAPSPINRASRRVRAPPFLPKLTLKVVQKCPRLDGSPRVPQ